MWNIIIGAMLILLAGYQIYRGRISSMDENNRSYRVVRAEKPVYFWLIVFAEVLVGALIALGVFGRL